MFRLPFLQQFNRLGIAHFFQCKKLSSISFAKGSKLKSIGEDAFKGTAIESIEFPSAVEEIGNKIFYKCENLSSISFPAYSMLKRIRDFSFCLTNIKSVEIPSIGIIGENAFMESGLESFEFLSSIKEIGSCAFINCKRLTSFSFEKESKIKIIREKTLKTTNIESYELHHKLK